MTTLKIIFDFSHQNLDINWNQLEQVPNLKGVVLKVSEGITEQDPMFAVRLKEAVTRGIAVKALYLFYHPGDDPNLQVENYIKARNLANADKSIPAVLDLEWDEDPKEWANVAEAKRYSDLRTTIARLEAEGYEVMIYSSHAFVSQYLPNAEFLINYKLWVAWYEAGPPLLPKPWTVWTWWQYTGSGNVAGIQGPVDISYVNDEPSAV